MMNLFATVVVGAALLLAAPSPCSAAPNDGGIVTLPLLNHHHVVDRRRRELLAVGKDSDDLNNNLQTDRIPAPPRNNNNLRHLAGQQQIGALYQGYGTHYIDIWVGYPPQRQTAVVDTGSSVTAFPCSECTDCGRHADSPFNQKASESFRATHCPNDGRCLFGKCDLAGMCIVEHNFGTPGSADASSWTAYEASDVAYAGGPHDRGIDGATEIPKMSNSEDDEDDPIHSVEFSFPLTFGCQTSVSGYFKFQLASGIMGLDRRAQSFWGQMRASQVIHRAQFSLCFVKQPIASVSGSTAGAVTLGGVDDRLHKTPMVFAKSMGEGSTASFKVRLRKMYLREGNDQSVMYDAKSKYHNLNIAEESLNGKEMYSFDSGTTDTYFIKSLSTEFRNIWKEITGMEYSNEAIAIKSESELHKFPTVILQMIPHEGGIGDEVETNDPREVPGLSGNIDTSMPNDILLAIPPKHYMQHNSKDGTYTSRIYLDRDDGLGNVLGANTMMGHDILFDLDGARIGFSESDCDYAKLVAESGSASEVINEGDSMLGEAALWEEEEDDDVMICESVKCRTLFGLTVAGLAFVLFYFARKYVNKPLTDASREYEMKSSANLHSRRRSYSDELPPPRYSDDNAPSSSYSDRRSSRSERSSGGGSRRDRSGSEERRHQERRSSARSSASADGGGSLRSGRSGRNSIHSHRSERSTGSGGSGGSRETRQSTSARSHLSRESHRSSHSHESGGGRSHRSSASGGSRTHRSSSNRSSGSRERGASGSTRYRDDYDEVPIPPAIS